nr:Host cell factor 2 [Polyrhizophydium stewartii]
MFLFGGIQEHSDGDVVTNEVPARSAVSALPFAPLTPRPKNIPVAQLYRFDIQSRAFSPLVPLQKRSLPSPRLGATATFVPPGSGPFAEPSIYVHGGLAGSHMPLSEFNVFNLVHQRWYSCEPRGTPPVGRESHSAVYWPGSETASRRIVFYGGFSGVKEDEFQRLDDVVYYNIDTHTWSRPHVRGFVPPGRSLHSSIVLGSKMIVFGGWEPRNAALLTAGGRAGSRRGGGSKSQPPAAVHDVSRMDHTLPPWVCSNSVYAFDIGHAAVLVGNMMLVVGGNLGHDPTSHMQHCINDIWALEIGPPPPPGALKACASTATASALYSDNLVDGSPAVLFTWDDDYAWIPGRTYRIEVRDVSANEAHWRVLYEGVERTFTAPLVSPLDSSAMSIGTSGLTSPVRLSSAPDSSMLPVDDLRQGHTYLVRALAVNFAGDSSQWQPARGEPVHEPLLVRDGQMLQSDQVDLPIVPAKLTASLVAGNAGGPMLKLSWHSPVRKPASRPYRVECRVIVELAVVKGESLLPRTKTVESVTDSASRSSQSKKLRGEDGVAMRLSSNSDNPAAGEGNSADVHGEWITLWEGKKPGVVVSLELLRDMILHPTLEARFSTSAPADENVDSSVDADASRKRTRLNTDDGLEAPATLDAALRAVQAIAFEFRVCFARSNGLPSTPNDWTMPVHLEMPQLAISQLVPSLGSPSQQVAQKQMKPSQLQSQAQQAPEQPGDSKLGSETATADTGATETLLSSAAELGVARVGSDIDIAALADSKPKFIFATPQRPSDAESGDAAVKAQQRAREGRPPMPPPPPASTALRLPHDSLQRRDNAADAKLESKSLSAEIPFAKMLSLSESATPPPSAATDVLASVRHSKQGTATSESMPPPLPAAGVSASASHPEARPSGGPAKQEQAPVLSINTAGRRSSGANEQMSATSADDDHDGDHDGEMHTATSSQQQDMAVDADSLTELWNISPDLPRIGDPSMPFYYRLKFGDRIKVRKLKLRKSRKLSGGQTSDPVGEEWFPARVVYYIPTPDRKSWRIKIHYEGLRKEMDQFVPLGSNAPDYIREWADTSVQAQPAGDLDEEGLFDPTSEKAYLLNKKQRETAMRTGYVVKM